MGKSTIYGRWGLRQLNLISQTDSNVSASMEAAPIHNTYNIWHPPKARCLALSCFWSSSMTCHNRWRTIVPYLRTIRQRTRPGKTSQQPLWVCPVTSLQLHPGLIFGACCLMPKKANIWWSVVENCKVWHHNPPYLWLAFRYHKWKFTNIWE